MRGPLAADLIRRMSFRLAVSSLVFLAGVPALAQSAGPVPTALPFLEIAPSPDAAGMGGAGVAQPGGGPFAALANPALAGLTARDVVVATAMGPGAHNWRDLGDIRLSASAYMLGLEARPLSVPITIGASAVRTTMSYGDRALAGASVTYEPADHFDALSLGAATAGRVRVALGFAVREVSSTDRVQVLNGRADASSIGGFTTDVGAAVSADVVALAGLEAARLPAFGTVAPVLEVTVGYAQSHIGGSVRYTGGEWQALPRTARLGWGAGAGLDRTMGSAGTMRLVELELAIQSETRLVRERTDNEFSYAPAMGDMSMADALLGRGDDVVTGRRGLRVTLLDAVSFSRGWFGGAGYPNTASRALEVRLAGPLRIAAALAGTRRLAAVATHFDLRWTRAVTFVDTPHETTMNGFSLSVSR